MKRPDKLPFLGQLLGAYPLYTVDCLIL